MDTDYTIFTKILALRLQTTLSKIINLCQRGFMKGRRISHTSHSIDMLPQARTNQTKDILVSLNFMKAFDTIGKRSITIALNVFKFCSNMVHTVIYKTESCVGNGGWQSDWFPIARDVRQGCCVRPLLFVLPVGIMSIKLSCCPNTPSMNSEAKLAVKTVQ